MSGGYFDYLCYEETEDLFSRTKDLEKMREKLIAYGYEDIAKDTQRLIEYIKSADCVIGTLKDMLSPVFHAVEWKESGDWGEEDMVEILEKYRRKELENEHEGK